LESDELESLTVGISVLTTPIPINFADERDLLSKLRPGVDGLVLEVGRSLGTLLPSVWEALPESEAFLRQLKRKAGLDPDFWSNEIRVSRYTAEEFGPSP
jgi:AmmeMemoRadiSam system protein A